MIPPDTQSENDSQTRFARAEIECLCIMQTLGRDGSTVLELATRLGLSEGLAEAVGEAVVPLIQQGRVEKREDRLVVTESGHSWMNERLGTSA